MTRMQKILLLLARAFKRQTAAGHTAKAARIQKAQDDLRPPLKIRYPGVAAARSQSEKGGVPGDPAAKNVGEGWCLLMVRLCFGAPAGTPDAITAWNNAKTKHSTTNLTAVPRGYPIFWQGGSAGHGHIAVSAGDGFCWSTDIKRIGFFDRVPIAQIHTQWGLAFLGWTEDLNGVPVVAKKETR